MSNHVVCFTKNKHTIKAIAFSKQMSWTWLSLWVTEQHHVLACLKQWSYNKTQIPNDQIRSTLCIATRGNVSKVCILKVFEMIWKCRKHFENNVFKSCTVTLFKTIWNCTYHFENNVSYACILTIFETIWNCIEKMRTMSLKHVFWGYGNNLELQRNRWKQCF